MLYTAEMLADFVMKETGAGNIHAASDIFDDAGIDGDDFHELMDKYAQQYAVDMHNYRWYFHGNEEGGVNIGGAFFPPPYERVKRIRLTPAMLADFANKGFWDMNYPELHLPKYRYDLLVNRLILLTVVIIVICIYTFS